MRTGLDSEGTMRPGVAQHREPSVRWTLSSPKSSWRGRAQLSDDPILDPMEGQDLPISTRTIVRIGNSYERRLRSRRESGRSKSAEPSDQSSIARPA